MAGPFRDQLVEIVGLGDNIYCTDNPGQPYNEGAGLGLPQPDRAGGRLPLLTRRTGQSRQYPRPRAAHHAAARGSPRKSAA